MLYCTAVNCMDGRIQVSVIEFLQKRFDAEYVDMITEPGMNLILHEGKDRAILESVLNKVRLSVEGHDSQGIAVVGHFDCFVNAGSKDEQRVHTQSGVDWLRGYFPSMSIIGLWVDEKFRVEEL